MPGRLMSQQIELILSDDDDDDGVLNAGKQ